MSREVESRPRDGEAPGRYSTRRREIELFGKAHRSIAAGSLNNGTDKEKEVLAAAAMTVNKLKAQKRYLEGFARNNPFTKRQAYVSKKLDVQAAVGVLDDYLKDPNVPVEKQQFLKDAKAQLLKRQRELDQKMNDPSVDEHVSDPNSLMGPPGLLFDAKGAMGKGKKLFAQLKQKRGNVLTKEGREFRKQRKELEGNRNLIVSMVGQSASLDNCPLESASINENDMMREFLLATLKKAGLPADPKKVNAKQGENHVKAHNNQDWKVVDRKYLFRNKNGQQVECRSVVTPASRLGPSFDDMQGHGVCRMTSRALSMPWAFVRVNP